MAPQEPDSPIGYRSDIIDITSSHNPIHTRECEKPVEEPRRGDRSRYERLEEQAGDRSRWMES